MSDPYVIPGTNTLVNKLGLTDRVELDIAEEEWTNKRTFEYLAQLASKKRSAAPTFDLGDLKSIHRYVFQDVYPWAGKFRTVDIAKTDVFASARLLDGAGSKIFSHLNGQIHSLCSGEHAKVSRDDFVELSSELLGNVNALHPFREGNGRTQRILIQAVAHELNFKVDWSHITGRQMIDASIHSLRHDDSLFKDLLGNCVSRQPTAQSRDRYVIFDGLKPKQSIHEKDQKYIERGPER